MPHLPFSSSAASFAVRDERGAYATHDSDGRIVTPAALFQPSDSLVKRRATAVHDFDNSLTANGEHRPIGRSNSTVSLLYQRPSTHDSSAFCGTMGHLHNSVRVNHTHSARPMLASVIQGESFVIYADSPTYATPSAVDYEPASHLASTRRAPNSRWRTAFDEPGHRRPKFSGDARAPDQWHDARSGGMPHVSNQPRLVDTTPVGNHARVADATPGPGAYPASEFSDFAPRQRLVRVGSIGGLLATRKTTRLDGFGREHPSVRGCTSSFGSGPRSDIRESFVDGRRVMIQGLAERTRTPGGAMYSSLTQDSRVYMTHKGQSGSQRFTKEALGITMHDASKNGRIPRSSSALLRLQRR